MNFNHATWSRKGKAIGGTVAAFIAIGAVTTACAPAEDAESDAVVATVVSDAPVETEPAVVGTQAPTATEAPIATAAPTTAIPTPTEPEVPAEYSNALRKAESYIDYTAFSQPGLVTQLEFEGYSVEASQWAVQNITVDWLDQAASKARSYLEYSAFSEDGLRTQLDFEEFTPEQVEFAIGVMKTEGLV